MFFLLWCLGLLGFEGFLLLLTFLLLSCLFFGCFLAVMMLATCLSWVNFCLGCDFRSNTQKLLKGVSAKGCAAFGNSVILHYFGPETVTHKNPLHLVFSILLKPFLLQSTKWKQSLIFSGAYQKDNQHRARVCPPIPHSFSIVSRSGNLFSLSLLLSPYAWIVVHVSPSAEKIESSNWPLAQRVHVLLRCLSQGPALRKIRPKQVSPTKHHTWAPIPTPS